MVEKAKPVVLGPCSEVEADELVKIYKNQGDQAKKKPRSGREGQFMVEVNMNP